MAKLLLPLLLSLLLLLPSPPAKAAEEASPEAAAVCQRPDLPPFVADLRSRCGVSTECHWAVEVNGETILKELDRSKSDYYAILFYASWCPFSQRMREIFDDLSSMFPQITHLAVEESKVMPTILSRYGVRSFPSILIAHGSFVFWPLGSKDLNTLVNFYSAVTGLEPVVYLGPRELSKSGSTNPIKPWNSSMTEAVKSEPYLAFSILFICLRIFLFFFPKFFSCLKDFSVQYFRHVNLGILAKLSQLLECAPHVVDVRKIWSKLRLMVGAKNAKVWASSLTSVSLGGQSSARAAAFD